MGLLEDAIKEHLELKKAHGADEGEVKHEAEALLGGRIDEKPAATEHAAELEVSSPTGQSNSGAEAEVPEPAEPPQPPSPEPEPVAEVPEPAEPPAPPRPKPEPVAEVPEPSEPPTEPTPPPESVAQDPPATIDFDWKAETKAADAEAAKHENLFGEKAPLPVGDEPSEVTDDLLEATPEFFQETPEYDRLWFEEKAPKDFNFDS